MDSCSSDIPVTSPGPTEIQYTKTVPWLLIPSVGGCCLSASSFGGRVSFRITVCIYKTFTLTKYYTVVILSSSSCSSFLLLAALRIVLPTGYISLGDWVEVMEKECHLNLPWRVLRDKLVSLHPITGEVDYHSCFSEEAFKKNLAIKVGWVCSLGLRELCFELFEPQS